MAKVLNLNVVALGLIGENVQVRVRTKNDVLQIRPTDRVLGTNLPEGEKLLGLSFKREDGKVRGAVLNMKDIEADAGQAFEIIKAKYGWLALVPVAEVGKGVAYGRVASK